MDTAPGEDPAPPGSGPPPAGGSGPPADAGSGSGTGDDGGAPADADEHEPPEGHDPLRFNKWMKRSATGAVLTGISLGLREALEPKRNLPAFMIEASGEPEDPDNPIQLHFDPDSPEDTVAVIRRPADKPDPETPPAP